MSTVAIVIIIVVVVLVLLSLFLLLPRMRERARVQKREHELRQRRRDAVEEHRSEAEARDRQAEQAEHRARIAEQEARRERAEAQLRQEKAALHERGLADHELVAEHEREEFAGTSAVPDRPGAGVGENPAAVRADPEPSGPTGTGALEGDGARAGRVGARGDERDRTSAYEEGRRAAEDPARIEDFEAGRRDERR